MSDAVIIQIMLVLLLVPLFIASGGMVLIGDWLNAREKRKKAAKAAAGGVESAAKPA